MNKIQLLTFFPDHLKFFAMKVCEIYIHKTDLKSQQRTNKPAAIMSVLVHKI